MMSYFLKCLCCSTDNSFNLMDGIVKLAATDNDCWLHRSNFYYTPFRFHYYYVFRVKNAEAVVIPVLLFDAMFCQQYVTCCRKAICTSRLVSSRTKNFGLNNFVDYHGRAQLNRIKYWRKEKKKIKHVFNWFSAGYVNLCGAVATISTNEYILLHWNCYGQTFSQGG